MATAKATITIDTFPTGIENTQRVITVRGTIAVDASPSMYAAGGLALSWPNDRIKTNQLVPFDVTFKSVGLTGTTVGGFGYLWNKASNTFQIVAAKTVVAGTSAPGEEMTDATAIPANVSNDTIRFEAKFIRNQG